jgi:prophage regulatory protein
MPNQDQNSERRPRRVLKLPQVLARTRLSRSKLYEDIAQGIFPAPIPLGPRAVGWLESEIDDWLDARVAERDVGAKPPPPPPRKSKRFDERGKAKPPPKPASETAANRKRPSDDSSDRRHSTSREHGRA